MENSEIEDLMSHAIEASKKAYSPYSKFNVGSAVITDDGAIFSGCNVENVSFGLTICAERTAIVKAISEGHKNIKAIAIYSPSGDISPCGACRQFINEFGTDILVIYSLNDSIRIKTIKELLPDVFSEETLS